MEYDDWGPGNWEHHLGGPDDSEFEQWEQDNYDDNDKDDYPDYFEEYDNTFFIDPDVEYRRFDQSKADREQEIKREIEHRKERELALLKAEQERKKEQEITLKMIAFNQHYIVGDIILHCIFGSGTIISIVPQVICGKQDYLFTVQFDNFNTKYLSLRSTIDKVTKNSD